VELAPPGESGAWVKHQKLLHPGKVSLKMHSIPKPFSTEWKVAAKRMPFPEAFSVAKKGNFSHLKIFQQRSFLTRSKWTSATKIGSAKNRLFLYSLLRENCWFPQYKFEPPQKQSNPPLTYPQTWVTGQ
jgi:hypothetical protein